MNKEKVLDSLITCKVASTFLAEINDWFNPFTLPYLLKSTLWIYTCKPDNSLKIVMNIF